MGSKRLVINLDEAEHRALAEDARRVDMTVSNYVRKAVGLPPVKWGVKRAVPAKKAAKKKA